VINLGRPLQQSEDGNHQYSLFFTGSETESPYWNIRPSARGNQGEQEVLIEADSLENSTGGALKSD